MSLGALTQKGTTSGKRVGIIARLRALDKRQRIRYAIMLIGILALTPPVAFLAQLAGGAGFCGPFCARMAIGSGFVSTLGRRPWAVAMLFTWLGITFVSGRWVCSHFCPVGGLTEFGSKLWPKESKIDYARILHTPLFRYGFLGAWIALPILGLGSICCAYCPQSTFTGLVGAFFATDSLHAVTTGYRAVTLALFGLTLGVASRDGRGHCHLVCPIGALDSLVNAIGSRLPFAWRVRVKQEHCVGCGTCVEACPAAAISLKAHADPVATISYHQCNQCRVCEAVCLQQAIAYGRKGAGQV